VGTGGNVGSGGIVGSGTTGSVGPGETRGDGSGSTVGSTDGEAVTTGAGLSPKVGEATGLLTGIPTVLRASTATATTRAPTPLLRAALLPGFRITFPFGQHTSQGGPGGGVGSHTPPTESRLHGAISKG